MMTMKLKRFLTLILISMMTILSGDGCSTINAHVFEQADKKDTGVLCIGMENSRYAGSCPGAQVDATRMFELLSKKYSDNATLLVSQQATKAAVIAKMRDVLQKDLAIIFYSGHGGDQKQSAATKLSYPEPSGKDQFLCLYDKQLLDDEIWSLLCQAKGRVVLICDCCHSGTMFRAPMSFSNGKVLKARGAEPRLFYLGGCIDQSYSYGDSSGGLMTNAFLKHFKESMTYEDMWKALHNDKALNAQEQIQNAAFGESFRHFLIFR